MPRPTVAVLSALVLAVLLPAVPVWAQGEDQQAPSPTTTSTTSTTSTTLLPPADDPGAVGDAPAPPPLGDEEIPEAPAESEDGGEDTDHELIVGSAEVASTRLAQLEDELVAAEVLVLDLEARLELFDTFERDLSAMRRDVVVALNRAREHRLNHAIGAYVRGGPPGLEVGLGSGPNDEAEVSELLTSVLQADDAEVARLVDRRADLTQRLEDVKRERASSELELREARLAVAAAEEAVDSGSYAARIFAAGSEVAITGFVFPVDGPHDFIDSWGYPRAGGRPHQGTDIMASRGTPLVAVEDGVLARVGNDRLGGIKLWVVGESGTHYYYAHLERYAIGVNEGAPVDAGDVIGYVGDTGDAKGTPPHLHFQLHPNGGDPVNPYPLLNVVDELEADRDDS